MEAGFIGFHGFCLGKWLIWYTLSQTKPKPYCCVLTQPKTTTVPLQVYSNRYKRALKTGDLSIFQSFLSWLKIKDKTNTDNSALNFEQFWTGCCPNTLFITFCIFPIHGCSAAYECLGILEGGFGKCSGYESLCVQWLASVPKLQQMLLLLLTSSEVLIIFPLLSRLFLGVW